MFSSPRLIRLLLGCNNMKKIIVFLLFAIAALAQVRYQTVTFDDTTTSALLTAPSGMYLAAIAKPDSMDDEITLDAFLTASDTMRYSIVTANADSIYTMKLKSDVKAYGIALPKELFGIWRYFKVIFLTKATDQIVVIWKHDR
jgi:hypothetical protein